MTDAQLRTLHALDWQLARVTEMRGLLPGPVLADLYRHALDTFGALLADMEVAA